MGNTFGKRKNLPEQQVHHDGSIRLNIAIPAKYLQIGKEIGRGGFGTVYEGSYNRAPVAIKKPHGTMTTAKQEEFLNETGMMKNLNFPHIVTLYGVCLNPNNYCLVMELMSKGSLFHLIHNNQQLDWHLGSRIGADIAVGLNHLHQHKPEILHRDLKSLNVLLDDHLRAKLCDFGLSKFKPNTKDNFYRIAQAGTGEQLVGTWAWMAPELFKDNPEYSKASDMYAYGMVLWEMVARQLPFADVKNPWNIPREIQRGNKQEIIPRHCPPKLAKLITDCWNLRVQNRPTAGQAINIVYDFLETFKGDEGLQKKLPIKPNWDTLITQGMTKLTVTVASHNLNRPQIKPNWASTEPQGASDLTVTLTQRPQNKRRTHTPLAPQAAGVLVSLQNANRIALIDTLSSGHSWYVHSVAFSGRGDVLASGSCESVLLWEVCSGRLLQTLSGHTNWVRSVAFSPRGDVLASGSYDKTVRLWEVSSGRLLQTLSGHTSWVRSVAFSPKGDVLASGSDDKTVRLWEVCSGRLLKTLYGHTYWVYSVAFSPRGDVLASGNDNTVRLWDVRRGWKFRRCLNTLSGHTSYVRSVAFSPTGDVLASGSEDKTVRLWEVSSGRLLNTLSGHTDDVTSVAFSPKGDVLASGSGEYDGNDNTVRIWEVCSGRLLNTLSGHTDDVNSVAFSPTGDVLASGSKDCNVRIWGVPGK